MQQNLWEHGTVYCMVARKNTIAPPAPPVETLDELRARTAAAFDRFDDELAKTKRLALFLSSYLESVR